MDFAVQIGSGSTVIYKKNDGIVLNEASKIAYTYVRNSQKAKDIHLKERNESHYVSKVGAKESGGSNACSSKTCREESGADKKAKKSKCKIKVVAVGEAAKRMQDRAGKSVLIESPVSGGRVVDLSLAKSFFCEIFKKVAGPLALSRTCLFCVPCSLSAAEISDYKSVAYASGIDSVEFIPNSVAGAIAMGADVMGSTAVMYVNISEGGTDIAVITYGGILAGGSIEDGGAEATRLVHEYIESKYKIVISRHMAESAKVECATLLLNNEVSFKVKGVDPESGLPKEAWFSGVDCYKAMLPVYSRIAKAVLQVCSECNPDVINDLKSGAIYFGGGASSPVGLREFMTMNLDMNVVLNADSVNSVILGAGRLLNDKVLLKKIIRAN